MDKLKSRKLIAFLAVVLLYGINGYLGNPIDDETMAGISTLAIGYIVGQGLADFGKEGQVAKALGGQAGQAVAKAIADGEPSPGSSDSQKPA